MKFWKRAGNWLKVGLVFCMVLLAGTAALAASSQNGSYSQLVDGTTTLKIKKDLAGDVPDYARYFEFEINYVYNDRFTDKMYVTVDALDPEGTTVDLSRMEYIQSIREVTEVPDGYRVEPAYLLRRQYQNEGTLSFSPLGNDNQPIKKKVTTETLGAGSDSILIRLPSNDPGDIGDVGDDVDSDSYESHEENKYHFTVSGPSGYFKDVTLDKNHREETLTGLAPGEYTFTTDTIGGMFYTKGEKGFSFSGNGEWNDDNDGGSKDIHSDDTPIRICKVGGEANTDYYFSLYFDDNGSRKYLTPNAEGMTVYKTDDIGASGASFTEVDTSGWGEYFVLHTNENGEGDIKIDPPSEIRERSPTVNIFVRQMGHGFYNPDLIFVATDETEYKVEDGPPSGDASQMRGGTLVVTNTYEKTKPTLGVLTISKRVEGAGANPDDQFPFRVTLYKGGEVWDYNTGGEEGEPGFEHPWAYHRVPFEHGVTYVELRGGESQSIINLPTEVDGEPITYTVAEKRAWEGYTLVSSTNTSGPIVPGVTEVGFVNRKDSQEPGPEVPRTGSLSISKTVTGEGGDQFKDFLFTITLTDSGGAPLTRSFAYTGSKVGAISSGGTIVLRHGEKVTIGSLPEGTRYTVKETPAEGYTTTPAGGEAAGSITAWNTARADFINDRPAPEESPSPGPDGSPEPGTSPGPDESPEPGESPGPGESPNPNESPAPGTTPTPRPGATPTPGPQNPGYPTELPDPNDPDSPDEITIWEDDVPKTYIKVWDPDDEEWVYIPEDDVPLADRPTSDNGVPRTGDSFLLWGVIAVISGAGALTLIVAGRRKKE